jgi:hypothetical protein
VFQWKELILLMLRQVTLAAIELAAGISLTFHEIEARFKTFVSVAVDLLI